MERFFLTNNCCQLLAHCRWFSSGSPASSTTKTDRHDITESCAKHNKSNQSNLISKCQESDRSMEVNMERFLIYKISYY
jgi:hypothetical protein